MPGSLDKSISDAGSFLSEASAWIPEWLPNSAWLEHAPFAFWLVEALEPEVLIELGTYMGYSFFAFCQAIARLKLSTRTYAVDTWKGDEHAGFYGEEVFQEVNAHNAERYSGFSQLIRSTFDDALPYFEDGSVDLLHIDGRHFYEDVKHDFNSWLPKLSDRGIVLLHDINVRERSFGVFRFWAELSQRYPHFQFFHGWGLGVLGIGKKLPRPLKAIFEAEGNTKRANKIRNIYARLGTSLDDRSAHRRSAAEIGLKEAEASALKAQISSLEVHAAETRDASEAASLELSDVRGRLLASEARGAELEAALTLRTGELSAVKVTFAEKEQKAAQQHSEPETALCATRQRLDTSELQLAAAQAALAQQRDDAAHERAVLERRLVEAEQSAAQQCVDLQDKLAKSEKSAAQQRADLEAKLAEAKRSAAQQCADLQDKLTKSEKFAAQQSTGLTSKLAEGRQQLQSTTAQLAAAKSDYQVALRDVRRELALKTAQLDAAKAQLDAAEARLAESAAKLARQRDDTVRQRAELEARCAASQERAIAAETRRESLQAEHDSVLNSSFWRATAPARRLAAVLPQDARRQARRGARLLYWVLTPHRIAARIADRRARRDNLEKSNTPAWAALLDRGWYLERYPDVAAGADSGDPLRHFIQHGAAERRDPNAFFNTVWYLESNPDVARAGDNALAHYFEHGADEGRDPSPLFDTSWYLETHGDVAAAGTNPLLHYLRHGAAEGRATRAPELPTGQLVDPNKPLQFESQISRAIVRCKSMHSPAMRIAFVGQQEYFGCHYETDLDDLYDVRRFQLRFGAGVEYYRELLDFRPDITIAFRGELLPIALVDELSGIRISFSTEPMPKILDHKLHHTSDSLGRFTNFLDVFERSYDFVFHYDESSRNFFESQGIRLSGFFPLPIATETYKPISIEKTRDILFFGRSTEHRERILGPLKRDFDVLHLAHGWPGMHSHMVADFVRSIASFRVCLNLHAENELSWEPRVQQLLSCGALVISDRLSPNNYLVPGRDYLEATDPEGFYQICQDILADVGGVKAIRESGHKLVTETLSAQTWFPKLFDSISERKFSEATFERCCLDVNALHAVLDCPGFAHVGQFVSLRNA